MVMKLPIVSKYDPKGVNDAETSFQRLSGIAAGVSTAMVAAFAGVTYAVGNIAIDSVKIASDYQETASAVQRIFGDAAQSLIDFGKTAPDVLGQTQTQFLDAVKTFGIFGNAAGLAADDNAAFSEQLAILATDMASFNNTSVDEAISAIGAGLRGESEPLRNFGVLLDDATLKARAMEMGIYDGTDALTPQQKVLAAQAEILAQTSMQQGDFARTQDGMANSSKELAAKFEDMQKKLGDKLIPVFEDFVAKMIDFIDNNGPMIEDALQAISDMVIGVVDAFIGFTDWYSENKTLGDAIATTLGIMAVALGVATTAVWAFNVALYANPIGLIVAAAVISIGVLIAIIVLTMTYWDELTRGMKVAWDIVSYGIQSAWATVANSVIDGINTIINAFNGLLDIWNQILGTSWHVDLVARVSTPDQPMVLRSGAGTAQTYTSGGLKLAEGGIVLPRPGGTMATIGEGGSAEAVIPLDRLGKMMGGSGGSTYVVNVNGGLNTSAEIGRAVVDAIKKFERTSGPVFASA
jgi:hypothetical protein